MTFELVVFDFDGTLADTRAAVKSCMAATFADLIGDTRYVDEDRIEMAISSGASLPGAVGLLTSSLPRSLRPNINDAVERYRARYAADGIGLTRLYPGVAQMLEYSYSSRRRSIVVSNKGTRALMDALSALKIAQFFDVILGEQPDLPPKPDPAIFERIIWPNVAVANRKNVLMVGDTLADLQFAKNVNIRKCWARYGYGDAVACRNTFPDFEIGSAHELSEILAR